MPANTYSSDVAVVGRVSRKAKELSVAGYSSDDGGGKGGGQYYVDLILFW